MQKSSVGKSQTISKYIERKDSPYPDWVKGDMDQGRATIYDNALNWIQNPRRVIRRRTKTMKNLRCCLNHFSGILKSFHPDELQLDHVYADFTDRLQSHFNSATIRNSTMETYVTNFTGKILQYGKVDPAVIADIKGDIRVIRKELKMEAPKSVEISDNQISRWVSRLDEMCKSPDNAPNLCRIANPKSSMAGAKNSRLMHLLAVRAYIWVCLVTAGRADEVRRIRIDEISEFWISRRVTKGKMYSEQVDTSLPTWAWHRILPYIRYVREHLPDAELMFCEDEKKMGRGTISPKTLRELVKGSMVEVGMPPTTPGGYYRTHDLRKVWIRWIDENGGTMEEITALLRNSPRVVRKHYYPKSVQQRLVMSALDKGFKELGNMLEMEELGAERIEELKATFADLSHITVNRDGTLDMSDETRYGGPDFITDWSPLPDLNWGPPDVCLHRRLCFFPTTVRCSTN